MNEFQTPPGATPIDLNEARGLLMPWIATQADLNAAEQINISAANLWLASVRHETILHEGFMRELHRRMFDKVWQWAGTFRRSNKNIGIEWQQVSIALRTLLDDTEYWCGYRTYPIDELAARFHHRLVSIHCFPNGNGRHARLAADVLLSLLDAKPFSWGASQNQKNLDVAGVIRQQYIAALRAADQHSFEELIKFARS
jgi:Fic-DOC domain mobile mystery protein B